MGVYTFNYLDRFVSITKLKTGQNKFMKNQLMTKQAYEGHETQSTL